MAKALKTDNTVKFFISVIGIAVICLILKELSHIFLPFVIAYFLFFFFSPLNTFLHNNKVPKFIIILFNICVTVFFLWISIDFVLTSFMQFSDEAPLYADKFNNVVRDVSLSLGIKDQYFTRFSIAKAIQKIDYKNLAGGVFSSTFSLTGSVLFVIFFFVFIVVGHESIYEAIRKRFVASAGKDEIKKIEKITIEHSAENEQLEIEKLKKEKEQKEAKLAATFKAITEQIQRYIIAKVGINIIAGALVYVALLILGVEFPMIWALFTFLFNFIPSIGSAVALILPVLFALVQNGSTGFALLVALILGVIQTLAFNIAEPTIIGKRLNLNPLLILFSLLIWGYIWGIVGMLLSVPLTAVIKIIISNSESENLKFISNLMSKD